MFESSEENDTAYPTSNQVMWVIPFRYNESKYFGIPSITLKMFLRV